MKPKSILIVDDDDFAIEVMSSAFEMMGVTNIHTARDGRYALNILSRPDVNPDYIICDIFMPNMDGIEFLIRLGSMKFGGGVMIVSGGDTSILNIAKTLCQEKSLKLLGTFIKPMSLDEISMALQSDLDEK